jgi:hypothetical protein
LTNALSIGNDKGVKYFNIKTFLVNAELNMHEIQITPFLKAAKSLAFTLLKKLYVGFSKNCFQGETFYTLFSALEFERSSEEGGKKLK